MLEEIMVMFLQFAAAFQIVLPLQFKNVLYILFHMGEAFCGVLPVSAYGETGGGWLPQVVIA